MYLELRRLAERYVRREQAKSIQATELVHEAYLRLARDQPRFQNRAHFIALAAISMRRLLVERARARGASKRFGGQVQVTLDGGLLAAENAAASAIDVIALDRALTKLAAVDPEQARIVELRFFGGLSVEETADAPSIPPATVKRHWAIATAYLLRELHGPDGT